MDNTKIKICEICGFQTDNGKVMSNHKRWKHITPVGSVAYKETQQKISESNTKDKTSNEMTCPECGNKFTVYGTERWLNSRKCPRYCSSYCRHKQGSKKVDYEKLSDWVKKHPVGCCSDEWRLAHQDFVIKQNHSKRELEIVDYFKTNFPDDDWKVGFIDGSRKHDGVLLNPDLWSKKLKVVIEYDGDWHWKNIHNQLEHKQHVDKVTTEWCAKNGYRLIRIDENLKINNQQISDVIYNSDKNVELFESDKYGYLSNELKLFK